MNFKMKIIQKKLMTFSGTSDPFRCHFYIFELFG